MCYNSYRSYKQRQELPITPQYLSPIINFYQVKNIFLPTKRDVFNQLQEDKFKRFLSNVQTECGVSLEQSQVAMNQKQLYYEGKSIANEIYGQTPDVIFEVQTTQIEVFLTLQMTELLQLLSNYYRLHIDAAQFSALLKFNSLPEKCVASLELLNMLKPALSPDEATAVILLCLTQRVVRGAFDDNYIIIMQDHITRMFNDRSPNQRAAMACGWSIISELRLVEQKHSNLYFELMVFGDTKMYTQVLFQTVHKLPQHHLHSLAWLLCHSPMLMRDSSYEIQKRNYDKIKNVLDNIIVEINEMDYAILADYVLEKGKVLLQHLDLLQNYKIK
ncbi:Transmembrane_domain-containing protein [Hexamita inflata]|uniref:Transmembrane domain-containing protein n=1 Tax=Hexamita inflata TaxID=28002 RepID=A0AA86NQD9_9EUKA|nr:Transmembrane domain-containing protein [Hexamita inflata]